MGGCLSKENEHIPDDGAAHLPKYEWVGELGFGRKGEIKLMRNRRTQELVAVKYIARQVMKYNRPILYRSVVYCRISIQLLRCGSWHHVYRLEWGSVSTQKGN